MKKIFALIITIFTLFPAFVFAGGYSVPNGKYLDIKKVNILTTYKDKTFTQYFNIGFQTDSQKFATIIPVEKNVEYGLVDDFDYLSYLKDIGQLSKFSLNSFSTYDNYPVSPNIAKDIDFTKADDLDQIYLLLKDNKLPVSSEFKQSLEKYKQNNLEFLIALFDLKDMATSSKLNFWAGETQTIKINYKTNRPIIYDALYNQSSLQSEIKPQYTNISISSHKTTLTDFTPIFGDFVKSSQAPALKQYIGNKDYLTLTVNKLADGQVTKDYVLNFNDPDNPINSNIRGFFESSSWYFIFFAVAIILIIISPFGVLFYYSSYVRNKIIHADFKRLYRFFQVFSYLGIIAISVLLIILLSKTQPLLIDNFLYYTGVRIKFSYLYYGTISAIVLINVINLLIIVLYNKKTIQKKIKKINAREKINRMFDIK